MTRTAWKWTIGLDEAVSRIMGSVAQESVLGRQGAPVPSPMQVSAVMHALADHTMLVQAVQFVPRADGGVPASVGRWLHGLGDYFERGPVNADKPWRISDEDVRDRLVRSLVRESVLARTGEQAPSTVQVAAVLHAFADYTALVQAVNYVPDSADGPAHSIGRWLHDLGDYFERGPLPVR